MKNMLTGIAASSGFCMGRAYVIKESNINVEVKNNINVESEIIKFNIALKKSTSELKTIWEQSKIKFGASEAEVFESHIMIIKDPELKETVESKIIGNKTNAEVALNDTINELCDFFNAMDNDYMKQRSADFKDIGNRILLNLLGEQSDQFSKIVDKCIIVSKDIAPSDTVKMDFNNVLGFVTDIGGRTSHSSIIARSLELPAVVGVQNATKAIHNDDFIIVDGKAGLVHINPDENLIRQYELKIIESKLSTQQLGTYSFLEARTSDGKRIAVCCNIGNPNDSQSVLKYGADGVGLFRTEFLYMNHMQMPCEEEQYIAYKLVAEKLPNRPIIIRTLDIGGDKKLPYLPTIEELNPFLGYRAIRICLDQIEIFKIQLKALLRASAFGDIRIMFPMISTYEELIKSKKILEEVKFELDNNEIEYNKNIKIGIMIETPAAAIISDVLAKECDFFSIGTNDLIQYTVAVDRQNERVAYLYNMYNPSVLKLINIVIKNAHLNNISVGICGEMASEPTLAPLFIGMEIDELSMSASSILPIKKCIRGLSQFDSKELTFQILQMKTCEEIAHTLIKYSDNKLLDI